MDRVWDEGLSARVAAGEIVWERFHLWPSDDVKEATERIGKSVVRFLHELFTDAFYSGNPWTVERRAGVNAATLLSGAASS